MISNNYKLVNLILIHITDNALAYKVYDLNTKKFYRLEVLKRSEY